MEKVFPTILIVLNFSAACMYLYKGSAKMTVYWLCACGLNIAITYLPD